MANITSIQSKDRGTQICALKKAFADCVIVFLLTPRQYNAEDSRGGRYQSAFEGISVMLGIWLLAIERQTASLHVDLFAVRAIELVSDQFVVAFNPLIGIDGISELEWRLRAYCERV